MGPLAAAYAASIRGKEATIEFLSYLLFALAACLGIGAGILVSAHIVSALRRLADGARAVQAGEVMVAVPVAAREALENVRKAADEVVCLGTPEPFYAVGAWYRRFDQVSDAEVCRILAADSRASFSGGPHPTRL